METIKKDAIDKAKELYEKIHSWPELGNCEFKTTKMIEEELQSLRLEIHSPLPTGLIADIKGRGAERIAFRADIDALPIQEKTDVPFCSKNHGVMHACGHDIHTAILVGLAHILACKKPQHNVRLLFQPDEEGDGGADRLIRAGALDGVSRIFGLHVMPELQAGKIGLKAGIVHGESRMFRIMISGQKSHGAKPHLGCDAIYCASVFISTCQGIISRSTNPLDPGLITFGTIHGGETGNVLADQVEITGIVRGVCCEKICDNMTKIAKGLGSALGAGIDVSFQQGYKRLKNNPQALEMVRQAAGKSGVELDSMTLTVDDFASYLYEVPGAFFFLGSGFEGKQNGGLHTGSFHADASCIGAGMNVLTQLCF